MTLEDQIYTTVESHSAIGLIAEIDKRVKGVAERYTEVMVQSISHDVLVQHNGLFIWTALIVVNVKGRIDVEEGNEGRTEV